MLCFQLTKRIYSTLHILYITLDYHWVHYLCSTIYFQPLADQLQPSLQVGDAATYPSELVRNIGAYFEFDTGMTMMPHVSRTVRSVPGYQVHIKPHPSVIDYWSAPKQFKVRECRSLTICKFSASRHAPRCSLHKLQLARTSAARLVSGVSRAQRTRITLCFSKQLHWLPVHLRMQHKLMSIVFNALNSASAPVHMKNLIKNNCRILRSSSSVKLHIPRAKSNITTNGHVQFLRLHCIELAA